jgi:hypothetical protein
MVRASKWGEFAQSGIVCRRAQVDLVAALENNVLYQLECRYKPMYEPFINP